MKSKHDKSSLTATDSQDALDAWADQIAALEPSVATAVAAYSQRLAGDRRLNADDRAFAAAQADAIRRALGRLQDRGAPGAGDKISRRRGGKS